MIKRSYTGRAKIFRQMLSSRKSLMATEYHSPTIPVILRTNISLIMTPERYSIMTVSLHIQAICGRSLRSLEAFQEKRPLDETLVKDFHKRLTRNTYDTRRYQLGERPGEYKKHDYVTGRNEIGASPEDVEEEMRELLDEMHDVPSEKILLAAAYFHVKFENIHPFADGNGRAGRLTMNYFLVINEHPPITWDESQELTQMVQFLKEQTVKTWEKQVLRSENVRLKHSAKLSQF